MAILNLIKRLPIDLGQGHYRHETKAKTVAFALAGDGNGKKALDFGCGDGFWSEQLKSRGWDVTSVDNYDFRYKYTQQVDAEQKLSFPDNTFELVWVLEVVEHVKHVEQLLDEFRRITKPGGRIIITTPNSNFWLYRILRPFGITPPKIQNPDHKQFFSFADMQRLFPQAYIYGFFPYTLIKLVISSGIGFLSPTFIVIEDQSA
ncbi:MAG: class I SAM-dependent methyltransferase [Candidatus Andersenbacteria bacterium]